MNEKEFIILEHLELKSLPTTINKFPEKITAHFPPDLQEETLEDVIQNLLNNEYVVQDNNVPQFIITKEGKEALAMERNNRDLDYKTKKLEYLKLRLDVKNSQRIFNTYWFTFWFSIIAFCISVTLLILKIVE